MLLKTVEVERNNPKKMRGPKHITQKPPAMTRPNREDQSNMEVLVVTCNHVVAVVTIQRRISHRQSSMIRLQAIQATRKLPSVLKLGKAMLANESDRL